MEEKDLISKINGMFALTNTVIYRVDESFEIPRPAILISVSTLIFREKPCIRDAATMADVRTYENRWIDDRVKLQVTIRGIIGWTVEEERQKVAAGNSSSSRSSRSSRSSSSSWRIETAAQKTAVAVASSWPHRPNLL